MGNITYNDGVALAGEDLNGVDFESLGVHTVNLNNGEVVVIDREGEVGVARHRDKTEAVAIQNM